MRRIIKISIWSLLMCGLIVTLGFVNAEQKSVPCKGIDIVIDHSTENMFIDETDIKTILLDKGDVLVGHPLSTLNITQMEKVIRNNPFVENAEVYETIDGEIKIEVKQRTPLLRIFNLQGQSFYLDENGTFMPTSEKYTSNVMAANGYITEPFSIRTLKFPKAEEAIDTNYKKTIIDDLFQMARFIKYNELLTSLIVQVYVNDVGEIEITPRVGNHQVLFGDISDMKEKFEKLVVLYQKGLSKTGWDNYLTIDLRYKNQVVCTKRNAITVVKEVEEHL